MTISFRRPLARTTFCAALAVVSLAATTARDALADGVAYVDCAWAPYRDAWGCALPATFAEGRFSAPPYFRQDDASEQARKRAWADAKAEPGARAQGRLGVFVPMTGGGWTFVPGPSWSPGDPVFLPHPRATTAQR
jgi:hypothetical protein